MRRCLLSRVTCSSLVFLESNTGGSKQTLKVDAHRKTNEASSSLDFGGLYDTVYC
jgi:hypothetical protein